MWVLWNRDREKPGKSSLVFREGCRPEHCLDLQTKQEVPLERETAEVRTGELEFGPADIRDPANAARRNLPGAAGVAESAARVVARHDAAPEEAAAVSRS